MDLDRSEINIEETKLMKLVFMWGSKMRSITKRLMIFMTIVMLLSMIPMVAVEASDDDVNYDTGDAGGNTGTGSTEWAFSLRGRGVRIGIYFVEGGEENFAHGIRPEEMEYNEETENSEETEETEIPYVIQVGYVTDFSKEVLENMQRKYGTKYDYTVEYYTGMSVFDYMNKVWNSIS